MNDHELAARLATEAGQLLLGVRDEFADADASERKAAGDKRSHDFLMEALTDERPDDAVLSEEGADNPVRLRSERVWIVDPLDGTREFSELGRDDWAVHVALWQAGELVAGAVALPAQGITLATPQVDPPPAAPDKPRIVVSRTRPPAIALTVRDALDGILVEMGSAGAKVASIVQGLSDVYVHAGGQFEWDSAAPWQWPELPVCIPPASTGPRWPTTNRTRSCRIWWSAVPSWRKPYWRSRADGTARPQRN